MCFLPANHVLAALSWLTFFWLLVMRMMTHLSVFGVDNTFVIPPPCFFSWSKDFSLMLDHKEALYSNGILKKHPKGTFLFLNNTMIIQETPDCLIFREISSGLERKTFLFKIAPCLFLESWKDSVKETVCLGFENYVIKSTWEWVLHFGLQILSEAKCRDRRSIYPLCRRRWCLYLDLT